VPELPEVEVARRSVEAWLGGQVVIHAELPASRVVRGNGLAGALVDRRIVEVQRRGKWLRLGLDDGRALFSHLGMTGKWVRRERSTPKLPYERARLDGKSASVRYLDPRLFGRLELFAEGEAPRAFDELGPDPLLDGLGGLGAALAKTSRPIKVALLDQTLLAGIGNIQATEALWRARLDPRQRANRMTKAEVKRLARGLLATLAYTLSVEDSDEISYVEEAGADNPFRVYGREGEPCPRCKAALTRLVQAGRSTFYCAACLKPSDGDRP